MLTQIELLLGSIGVTLSIFFGVILIRQRKQAISNIFLAIYLFTFGLRVGKSLFHNFFHFSPTLRTYFLHLLFCVGPALWLFIQYRVLEKNTFDRRAGFHLLPFVLLLPICWLIPNDGSSVWFSVFYNATIFHIIGYTTYALYWLNQQQAAKILQQPLAKHWLHTFLWANLGMMLTYLLISLVLLPFYLGISFSYSILMVVMSIYALKIPALFTLPPKKYQSSPLDKAQAQQLFTKLNNWLATEKSYLDPDLTLAKLSAQIQSSPKEISQAINQIEQLNYSQFIARYRVYEAQQLLQSPQYAHLKIAAIAYDSGFNSISSFNAQFKKYTAQTAQAYRKAKLKA